jgi:hypothetical protein
VPKRAWLVGRALWILLASCGSDDSAAPSPGSDDGGSGGDGGLGQNPDGGGGPSSASGAPTTCIVGTQGCLCDSGGECAPNLTCTPQAPPRPNLCCNGSNCTSTTGGSIGKSCSAAPGTAASCTPGITVPAAAGGMDSCGYPATDFVESTTLCAINAVGGGPKPAQIQVFYNDEHALTLGCATASFPVSPLSTDPAAVKYPQTGDPACVDTVGRPLRPVVFITDITADPNCTAGDMQKGGPAYDPVAVFGSWKSATEDVAGGNVGTPAMMDPAKNTWNLTTSADPIPPAATMACKEGYGAELRFEVGLISGHSYRIQVIAHDGDQNKGGDSGEACAIFCAGSGSLCDPGVTVCADGTACPGGTVCVQGCCLENGVH